MATNASSATAYATADDAFALYDVRVWSDLCGDVGAKYTTAQLKDLTTLPAQRLAALLMRASFEVEKAFTRGGRYSSADLNSLQGVNLAGLKGLVVDYAVTFADRARNFRAPTTDLKKEVDAAIKRIEDGEEIFALQETIDAGAGVSDVLPPGTSKGPRPLPSSIARGFYGRRGRSYADCWGSRWHG